YRMFGPGAAWLAVVLALFEPNLLANSTLVTADFGLACLCFAGVYALRRGAAHRDAFNWRRRSLRIGAGGKTLRHFPDSRADGFGGWGNRFGGQPRQSRGSASAGTGGSKVDCPPGRHRRLCS